MKIIERPLTAEQDSIPGYLACPERKERGPALLLVHQNTGVTDYIKIEALKFARLGYTTVVPDFYEMGNLFSVPCELKSFSADKHFSCFF